jgi:Ca2+-binding RTX toxin-like protein
MATRVGTESAETLLGTDAPDYLYGNGGNDTLIGLAEADYIDGGSGSDSMIGGLGNDTYFIDNLGDIVVENANEGIDTVWVPYSATLSGMFANIENLVLSGQNAILGTGNLSDNAIMGSAWANILDGLAGNDTINGNGGNDSVLGGLGNDSLLGDSGNDTLDGDVGIDTLEGGTGNDYLVGGAVGKTEIDYMVGGSGNDSYFVNNSGDVVSEASTQGIDIIYSTVDYSMPANVEFLFLTGSGDINATGGEFTNDSLVGNEGKNSLIGRGGNDTLLGLSGNDTLFGDNTLPGDTVSGNDSLIGGAGVDSLIGGLGNDTYEVAYDFRLTVTSQAELLALTPSQVINDDYVLQYDATTGTCILYQVLDQTQLNNLAAGWLNTGRTEVSVPSAYESTDVIIEGGTPADGIDLVRSSATFNLSTNALNVENLTLIGTAYINGTGNAGNNILTGNIGNNILDGADGNDTLDGSFGSDTLKGGDGDDYYILNSETEDTTIELAGEGADTIQSSVNFSLLARPTFSEIDNLVLTGSAILGKGNALANSIFGYTAENRLTLSNDNQLSGGAGADSLYGGLGSDVLDGGTGNDMLIGGTNTLFGGGSTLSGGFDTDTLNGNDQLLGGDGSDSLDGGFGNDILKGGQGGLVGLVGTGDTLLGGAGDDLLLGGTNPFPGQTDRDVTFPNDTLVGGDGNDTLDGGNSDPLTVVGNSLLGGLGDDLIYIRNANDLAIELLGEGNDTLIANFTLDISAAGSYANFEHAALFGSSNINLTGNEEGNLLSGNNGNNIIHGMSGNDTVQGGAGLDFLYGDEGNDFLDGGTSASPTQGDFMDGGEGNDVYVADNVNDRVLESQVVDDDGVDTVLTYVNFDPLPASDSNNVTRAPSFANLDLSSFARLENFLFLDDTLRGVGVAIRGVGNALGNEFTGNAENNVILGLGGDDTIIGNAGNDSLYGDRYNETPVYDPVTGIYPSNPGAYDVSNLTPAEQFLLIGAIPDGFDSLLGGDGDDLLSGNGGDDTLLGGGGNDSLIGGLDGDSMVGGLGGDAYYVDSEEDVVVENADEGTDHVLSTVDIFRLQDNIENLTIYGSAALGVGNDLDNAIGVYQVGWMFPVTLDGGAGNDIIKGYYSPPKDGLDRDADDYLSGGSGNDLIDGGLGADMLEGGLGNDTLAVDDVGDAMREYGSGGTDLVISTIDIDLSDADVDGGMFIENLTLLSGNIDGSGNRLNNIIIGSDGDNVLNGEDGNDTIFGGKGNDIIDGGAGDDIIRAGSNTFNRDNVEIDEITGGSGINAFDLTSELGEAFYRNITSDNAAAPEAYGIESYVNILDSGALTLKSVGRNTDINYDSGGEVVSKKDAETFYTAKDISSLPVGGNTFGILVSYNQSSTDPLDPTDDLIASGFASLDAAKAAINNATYL